MKTDLQLKEDIERELNFDPKVNDALIGVSVDKGVVTLRGVVDTYAEIWAAEEAIKRVSGVRTIAQDLSVRVLNADNHSDNEIAAAVQSALKWNVYVPISVTARVTNGSVTLEGQVEWNYERDEAEKIVRRIAGVFTIYNSISLKPQPSIDRVKEKVQEALQRQANEDAQSIKVETEGGKVTLSGHATSWQSIQDAATAAWAAPGVTDVVQNIHIR